MENAVKVVFVEARTFPILSAIQSSIHTVLQDLIFYFLLLCVVLFDVFLTSWVGSSASGIQVHARWLLG